MDERNHQTDGVSLDICSGTKAQALVYLGADHDPPLELRSLDIPNKLAPGQILARVKMTTICGSDLHTLAGKRKEACPSILGHEGVAEVIRCNRDDCLCGPGDRITFSIVDCCLRCNICQTGYPQKCQHLTKYGHLALSHLSGLNGTYCSHIILDRNTQTFLIPQTLSDVSVAPINCSLATMVNATRHIPKDGHFKTALVQGAGLLGVYACLLLREKFSLQRVVCTDINEDRLHLVSEFGATETYTSSADLPPNSVDVALEVCGHPSVVPAAVRCLRPGGLLLLVGLVHPDSQLNLTGETLIRKCLTVTGVHNYRPEDLGTAVEFIETVQHKYPLHTIISPAFPLQDFHKAFDCARKMKYLRVAMTPS